MNYKDEQIAMMKEKYAGIMVALEHGKTTSLWDYNDFEKDFIESMERAYELGFHTGFEDCAKMVERGEHLYCCITPGKAKETDSKHLTQSGEKE